MTLICMKIKLHAKLNFICKVSHLDSFETEAQENSEIMAYLLKVADMNCSIFYCSAWCYSCFMDRYSIQVSQPSEGLFMWARSTGLARYFDISFLRWNFDVFIREAVLEVKSSQTPPVRSQGRGEQIITVTYPPFLCGANISRALYSHVRVALPWQPREKNWINK